MERDERQRAAEWLDQLWMAGTGRLSWQVLHEFYWNAVRKMGLDRADAREIIEDLSRPPAQGGMRKRNGQPLSENFIRAYAICRTPAFLGT